MTPHKIGPRGPYASGLATKETILAAATEVFAKSGDAGFGMRDVAKAAGIAHPTVAYHFPSKTDLMRAVFVRFEKSFGLFDIGIDENGLLTTPVAVQHTLGDIMYQLVRDSIDPKASVYAMYDCRVAVLAADPANEFHDVFKKRSAILLRIITQDIAQMQAEGKVRTSLNAQTLGMLIINAWYGTSIVAAYPENPDTLSQTARFMLSVIEVLDLSPEMLHNWATEAPEDIRAVCMEIERVHQTSYAGESSFETARDILRVR